MHKRTAIVFAALMLVMTGIVWRLYDLATTNPSQVTEQQSFATVTVAKGRGNIYDHYGKKLVNRDVSFASCVVPYPDTLTALSQKLPTDEWAKLSEQLKQGRPVVTTLSQIYGSVGGLWQFMAPVRYTDNTLAPHLIGYLDGESYQGVSGIELALNEVLAAQAGEVKMTFEIDAAGRALEGVKPQISDTLRENAAGVVLTLDSTVQYIAETVAAAHMERGAVVILDPQTGGVRAMVSLPDFEPQNVGAVLDEAHAPLLNRALSNYNCGSVFKIVTVAAALESGLSPEQAFRCDGSVSVGEISFSCHSTLGHGEQTMKNAFAQSCNPYFIQLAQTVGSAALYEQAVALGLDSPILLANNYKTARALFPSLAELQAPAALANVSIGQGSFLATPVHVAQITAAVYNGGLLPSATVIEGYMATDGAFTAEENAPPTRVFSAQTAAVLQAFMENNMRHGTGTTATPATGRAGGKTGTAETGWVEDGVKVVQSWYTGYFETENHAYAIAIVGEDKNRTGVRAAPLFKELCEQLALLG